MREVDVAAHAGRAGVSHLGHDHHRRPRRHPSAAARPRRRDGLPELRAVSTPHGAGEHRVSAASLQDSPVGRAQARRRGGRVPRAGKILGAQAERPQRRPAATCRDRPRDHPRAVGVPVRRTTVQPRRQTAGRDPNRAAADPAQARHHLRLRHTRPGGGDDAVGPNGGDARRAHRAAGHPAGGVQHAGRHVRGGVRRQPEDEPGRRRTHG